MSAAEQTDTKGFTLHADVSQLCNYDFMRCSKCGRLITQIEMNRALRGIKDGRACPCGSLKYAPCDMPWYAWCYPRVWTFAWTRVRQIGWREALSRTPKTEESAR